MGYQDAITLPLRNESRIFGFFGLFPSRARDLEDSGLALLQELADNVAYGVGAIRAERRRIVAELASIASHDAITDLTRYKVRRTRALRPT